MAFFPSKKVVITPATLLVVVFLLISSSSAQLSEKFYANSCPKLLDTVKIAVQSAIDKESRMGASLLRLHFHDCFVKGCDGSVLLDDTSSLKGEKTAGPNKNSARGFEIVDAIKSAVEKKCPGVVSCADILAIAARDSVVALGGCNWDVKLGRRDARTADFTAANTSAIPAPTSNISTLIKRFRAVGLSTQDLVTLSGAHTIGNARCTVFRARLYNESNKLDASFRRNCPRNPGSGDNNLAPLDPTPAKFDIKYFTDLISNKGLLHSDQQLLSGGSGADSFVKQYSNDQEGFYKEFAAAMIRMGDISPLTGKNGEIRRNCRKVNS
ncbi:Peroxidase 52 [Orobanche minor]